METTLFVSEQYIKENTPLSDNISAKDIVNNIEVAQDMHTQSILGTNFYYEIMTKYKDQTLDANEVILVGHIKPSVAYRAATMALPFISYQIKNKGTQTQTGDFSSNADDSVISYLKNELENRAEFYEKRLLVYLCESGSLFPGYTTNNSTDMNPSSASPFDGGIALY